MLLWNTRRLLRTTVVLSFTPKLSRSMSVTTRDSSGTIIVAPRNEAAQSGLVVISHGLGDTAEGFVDVAEVTVNYMYIYIYCCCGTDAYILTSTFLFSVFSKGTAACQVYSPHSSHTASHNEYGDAHAFLV